MAIDISVIVPTNRVGGLDILFDALNKQTFKNFELVISDCLYQYRKNIVIEQAKKYDVNYIHVEPFNNSFPENAFCKIANTGLTYASGQLVVFIVDYTWLPENCLQTHWDYFCTHGKSLHRGLMGPHQYIQMPKLHEQFPKYNVVRQWLSSDNEEINTNEFFKYFDDIKTDKLSQFMWSVFDTNFNCDASTLPLCDMMANCDPKLNMQKGGIVDICFNAKNESISLEKVLSSNGWNEEFDGNHGWQDSELAERLNISWNVDPTNIVYNINPRYTFPPLNRKWSPTGLQTNEQIYMRMKSNGHSNNNSWSIIEKNQNKKYNLNLAIGSDMKDNCINLDVIKRKPDARYECDIIWDPKKDKIPFPDNSVNNIYAEYFLLHLSPCYHNQILKEIYRVLTLDGIATFGEVDMQIVMNRYLQNPMDQNLSHLIWGRQNYVYDENLKHINKHYQGFTENTLKCLLENNNFSSINRIYTHHTDVFYELTLTCKKNQV